MPASTGTEPQVTPITIYTDLVGHWGWVCEACRAESRYVYDEAATARRHAARHLKRCRKVQ